MLLTLALAVTAVAAEPNLMALPAIRRDVLEPRQTIDIPGLSGDCQSALSGVIGSVPSPPPRVLSAILGGDQTDPCSISVPSTLSSEFSSYSSGLNSWYSASSSELQSALSQCPQLSSFETELPLCTSRGDSGGAVGGGVPLTNSAGSTTGTSTASGASSGSSGSSSSNTAASGASGSSSSSSGSSASDNSATSTDSSSETGSGTGTGSGSGATNTDDSAAAHQDGRAGIVAALAAIGFAAFIL